MERDSSWSLSDCESESVRSRIGSRMGSDESMVPYQVVLDASDVDDLDRSERDVE